jgi:transcriptional regulator with GAF, ATPase, and Fis domain
LRSRAFARRETGSSQSADHRGFASGDRPRTFRERFGVTFYFTPVSASYRARAVASQLPRALAIRITKLRGPREIPRYGSCVFLTDSGASAFDALKDLLLEIAQERDLGTLLPLIVRRLAESSEDVALARIWLLEPGDACADCRNAAACAARERCLHLAASATRRRGGEVVLDTALAGAFRRIPVGAFKVGRVVERRQAIVVADARTDPDIARKAWVHEERIVSFGGQPLLYREHVLGALGVFVRVALTPAALDVLRLLANHAAAAIASARAFEEIERLQQRLQRENEYLREVVTSREDTAILGSSPAIRHVYTQVDLVAPTDASVLICGESGTGKELVAQAIHRKSRRAGSAFVRVNCAAIPRELYESEFFGHARGAFSGALRDRVGRFEAADKGTLFLDEVGEIPLDLQGKLLRVLQEGTFERVGETHSRSADVRIVAATNRDLLRDVAKGTFRQDLFYRLNVFPIETPPLRTRSSDITELAEHLIAEICQRMHRPRLAVGPREIADLEAYPWPGNVRELKNVLERAVILTPPSAETIVPPRLATREPTGQAPMSRSAGVLPEAEVRRLERENLLAALGACEGRIYGPGGAADLLGVKASTLASRLKKMGIVTRVG